jgi:cytochrome P450
MWYAARCIATLAFHDAAFLEAAKLGVLAGSVVAGIERPPTIKHPIDISSRAFIQTPTLYHQWLRTQAPVDKGKLSMITIYLLSHYNDCVALLKDPRFVRDRTMVTGGHNRLPIPVPRAIALLTKGMIMEDEPAHRRLRTLVHKAFTPRALARLEGRITQLTHDLLDAAAAQGNVNLMQAYALPIPVTVIKKLVGVLDADMPRFQSGIRVVSEGFSGWNFLRTIVWDLPAIIALVHELMKHNVRILATIVDRAAECMTTCHHQTPASPDHRCVVQTALSHEARWWI